MFLFDKINALRRARSGYADLPQIISGNLNAAFELRPYQEYAFRNFVTYYENDSLRQNPTQVLFHMATGSGKTLIMAGLMIYLYRCGYRNFLFFVHLDNIVKKTMENFLNKDSAKYLFADEIIIDGEAVRIIDVSNFQGASPDSISICFTTVQKLHTDMSSVKEGAPSFDDFIDAKTVLIADEAHHLNAGTKKGKGKADKNNQNWEMTVRRILETNRNNILLEFTATCDLRNPFILRDYEDKIIFNYPLKVFREEKYSKQIRAIRADISYEERMLMALMFSQYRLKVFQDNRLYIKPVILFKSKSIAESKAFEQRFYELVRTLTGAALQRIIEGFQLAEVKRMADYYAAKGIDYDGLAQELSDEFNPGRCISVNSKEEAGETQIVINTLENRDNPYRAVFAVDKLNEGWDVLNLFDIVRLYETRGAKNGKPGAATIAEAQLIGRGARYCPFAINDGDEKYKRKYDDDTGNPIRVCEELYYHCQYESRYFYELNKALVATGIMPDSQTEARCFIKDSFKKGPLYQAGTVFMDSRRAVSAKNAETLLPYIRSSGYTVRVNTGKTAVDMAMAGTITKTNVKTYEYRTTIKQIAAYNYSIVHSALRRIEVFKFNILREYFPDLKSLREFITDDIYLGEVKILIESPDETPTPETFFRACITVLTKISNEIPAIKDTCGR